MASVADTADRILADLRRRRDELKPLVGELERIEAAIDALERGEGGNGCGGPAGSARWRRAGVGNGPGAPAAPPPPRRSSTRRRRRRGRPRSGEPNRSDQFL